VHAGTDEEKGQERKGFAITRALGGDDGGGGGSRRRGRRDSRGSTSRGGSISGGSGSVIGLIGLRVDSNLDGNGATVDVLVVESVNCLLLLGLATDVNKAVALAFARIAPATTNDARRADGNASLFEEGLEASVVNVEAEVGNEEHRLGRLARGFFTCRTTGTERLLDLVLDARLLLRLDGGGIGSGHGGVVKGLTTLSGGRLLGLTLIKSIF
jgi:hypothetical protein